MPTNKRIKVDQLYITLYNLNEYSGNARIHFDPSNKFKKK